MTHTKAIAKALLLRGDKVLLLRRSETDSRRPLEWDIPGGEVEEDENFNEACAREIEEETGIKISHNELHLLYAYTEFFEKFGNVVWLTYGGKTTEATVSLNYEHSEFEWVELKKALEMITYERQNKSIRYVYEHELLN